jgi:ubiquinone/menaquinone biosynthesis C-methylase UbiE
MAAPQPGVETDRDGMWSPALARGLIRDDALRSMRYCNGYTDLLGPAIQARPSLAKRAMRGRTVAAIDERVWRRFIRAVMDLHGLPIFLDRENCSAASHFVDNQRVLDVACGPGDFTRSFANQLSGDGFVIGLDDSVPMMKRAVRDNSCARAVYMRADPLSLPFNNRAFDVVSCIAGLHLLPEPIGVLHEMVRVLSPGGLIAVMTSYGRESLAARKALELGAAICGVRIFDRTTVPAFFAAAGLVDIDQQLRGMSQFVTARRPAQVTELDLWRTGPASGRSRRRRLG